MTAASHFDLAALVAALGPAASRFDADAVAECDSTNSRIMARAETGAPPGTVLVADRQTAGRGRRGRGWIASPGDSLTFSLLWRFPAGSAAPAGLSLAVGLGVARGLDRFAPGAVQLKWPNDLLHGGRKLGGILIELVPGALRDAVIGIGLNLRLPAGLPEDIRGTTTALDAFVAPLPPRETALAAVLAALAPTLDTYAAGGFAALRDEWTARHAYAGRRVRILSDFATEREATCAGVDTDGALLVDTAAGRERLISGEISVRAT